VKQIHLIKHSTSNCNALSANQRGSALIIAVLIIAILTSLAVEFAYEVYIDTSALSNWRNAQKASLIAKSGQTLSSTVLSDIDSLSYTYLDEAYLPVEMDFGSNALLMVKVEDENSKFNINSIIFQNGLTNDEAFSSLKKLLEYLNINPTLALELADWIDPDHEPRLGDSEDNAKNSFLWSIEELTLIKGFDEKSYEAISPYITVHGNLSDRININTAKLPVLVSLHNDITETLAQKIIDYRSSTPFENTTHVQRVYGMETIGQSILHRITVKSSVFRILSMARVDEISRVVESVMDTSQQVRFWREG
jgi:general secretion pathway protein K